MIYQRAPKSNLASLTFVSSFTSIAGTVTACLVAVLCASASVTVFIGNMTICIALVFAVCGILVSVASTLVAMGVKFGVIEALSLSITVGLSVDYIIHLAHAYNVSTDTTRKLKSQSMLKIRSKVRLSALNVEY
jgi:predicted RND superfamily exporter protein